MSEELHKGANGKLFYYSRKNRKASTQAEKILWGALRDRRLRGFKFRRQHPISDFIADFYCHECKLIIELDGGYHDNIEQSQHDEGRTYELNELNVRVIRFSNTVVLNDLDFVQEEILKHLLK